MPAARRTIRFALADTREQLEAFAARWPEAAADPRGRAFTAADGAAVAVPPMLAPRLRPGEQVASYVRRCDATVGRHVVMLVRAAGVALGYWDGDELLRHKAIRKYVIRGKGKAQPTFLETRGKSRYGSRLRLQNWRRQLAETNRRLAGWWDELGAPDRLYVSVPVRVFADLRAAEPPPPFLDGEPPPERLPVHVHRPDHAELLRIRRWLAHGRVELPVT